VPVGGRYTDWVSSRQRTDLTALQIEATTLIGGLRSRVPWRLGAEWQRPKIGPHSGMITLSFRPLDRTLLRPPSAASRQ